MSVSSVAHVILDMRRSLVRALDLVPLSAALAVALGHDLLDVIWRHGAKVFGPLCSNHTARVVMVGNRRDTYQT